MKKLVNIFLTAFIAVLTLASCKKNDVAVTTCFPDSLTGNYTGVLTDNNGPEAGVVATVTKTSCTSVKVESSKFATITIPNLEASGPTGYVGKASTGIDVVITIINGNFKIVYGNDLVFDGAK